MDRILSKRIRRTPTTWDNVQYKPGVLENIFLRFPVKTLSQFKTVCNRWCKVIRSPSFMEQQLSLSKAEPTFILYPYVGEVTNVYMVDAAGDITEKVTLPGCENLSFLSMVCSYNGLVCFTNCPWVPDSEMTRVDYNELEIRMCNPATRKVHLLPTGSPAAAEPVVGVAFGPRDYKVFRIFHPKSESQDTLLAECEVYTPSTGAWRGIGSVPQCPMDCHNVFVNGNVYWFLPSAEDHRIAGSILSVDREENFQVIELPDNVTEHAFLVDLDGHLGLVAIYDDDLIMDIWLLKCNGEAAERWDKKCSDHIPYSIYECPDTVAVRKNDIFIITTERYFIFNISGMTWTEIDYEEQFERNCPAIFSYTESLYPCDGIMGPEI